MLVGRWVVWRVRHKPSGIAVEANTGRSSLAIRKSCMTVLRSLLAAIQRGGWASPVDVVRTYEPAPGEELEGP